MKKVKNISIGDKVFAKVKGYPAWPARVEQDLGHGKKFKVYFYGTGETGVVKPEDVFSYMEHKDTFSKHLKRKDYSEAVAQIEAALSEEGLKIEVKEEIIQEVEKPEEKRGMKRKLSGDSTSSESKKKALLLKSPAQAKITKAETEKSPGSVLSDEENELGYTDANRTEPIKGQEESTSDEEFLPDMSGINASRVSVNSKPTKFKVVVPQILREIIEEFERCVKDAEKGNEKPEDDFIGIESNEILLARVNGEQLIGIKLNQNRPEKSFETEVERLRWKESDARKALELKEKIENGFFKPESKPELFEFDLELTEDQLQDALQDRMLERKRTKLKLLKIEASMVELDASIKTNLALDCANPKEALKDLDALLGLNITPLMLKKHSHVLEMIKRLRRYIGNVKEWKMDGKELEEFKKDAEQIRNKAEVVYTKFKALFQVPENRTFWEIFIEECDKFKSITKDLAENQMFILCSEPGSKQAVLDELDEKEEAKFIDARNEKKLQDKENSSQVLNSEESFMDITTENSNLTHTSNDSHG